MFLFCFSRTTQYKDTPYVLKNNKFHQQNIKCENK